MREETLIHEILRQFPRSPDQHNGPFEADAEIMTIGDQLWAITMDEFSEAEDAFGGLEDATLGHNLVTGVLSDLFACGATPRFFLHAAALPPETENVETLVRGIRATLDEAGVFLIGGDMGRAPAWRYTGTALGRIESGRPVTRRMPASEQALWVTGTLGDANLAVLNRVAAPKLELRLPESKYVAEHATACIDTSGGLMDSLWMLHTQNPKMRIEIDAAGLPYDPSVLEFATAHHIPPPAFLFGGAGEYELLFATPADQTPDIPATRIGRAIPSSDAGLFLPIEGNPRRIAEPPPCPREYTDQGDYIQAILAQVQHVFG